MGILNEPEQRNLRHFLGLLLDADQPEAMLGSLMRVAELKARMASRGLTTDKQAALRWYALADALDKVDREIKGEKNARTRDSGGDRPTGRSWDGGPIRDGELPDGVPEPDEPE